MPTDRDNPDQHLVDRIREIDRILDGLSPEVIGDRIRRIRHQQSLSVRQLAAKAEISKTSLIRIEHGNRARPTTILAICTALGIHIQRIVTPEDDDLIIAATHQQEDDCWHDLRDFSSGPMGDHNGQLDPEQRATHAQDGAIPFCMLKSRLPDSEVLPCVIELHGPTESRSHVGSEFVYVLKGQLTVTVGEREFTLNQFESIAFRSAEPHRYAPSKAAALPTRILSVRIDERAGS